MSSVFKHRHLHVPKYKLVGDDDPTGIKRLQAEADRKGDNWFYDKDDELHVKLATGEWVVWHQADPTMIKCVLRVAPTSRGAA